MIDTPSTLYASVQNTATIHLTVPRTKMQQVMGPAIQEVLAAVTAQGAKPTGPVFSYHLKPPTDIFDFEVGVPVAKAVIPSGRVKPSVLPKGRIARTIYRGPYEGLGVAWGEFDEWINGQGLKAAPQLWECYGVGPQAGGDPSTWETELNRPLVD
jgi:effector-binding domain-containing protein